MWTREKIGAAAKEIADHLQLVEHVKTLQIAQKELSDALLSLSDRIKDIEAEMRVLKSDVKFESLKETQVIVNGVHGHLNKEIKELAVRLALAEARASHREVDRMSEADAARAIGSNKTPPPVDDAAS